MTEKKSVSIKDAECIQNAILEIVKQAELPFTPTNKNVLWNNLPDTLSIGLFPMQGAVYERKYVNGVYTASYPFRMVYRSYPKTNQETIDSQNTLTELAKWMETCEIELTSGDAIEKINRTSSTFPIGATEKDQEYAVNMTITYTGKEN